MSLFGQTDYAPVWHICLVSQIYHGSTPDHGTGKACYILKFTFKENQKLGNPH